MKQSCLDSFLYSMDDDTGPLRFSKFKVIGHCKGKLVAKELEGYFVGRELCDVDPEEIQQLQGAADCDCLKHMLENILHIQTQVGLCGLKKAKPQPK